MEGGAADPNHWKFISACKSSIKTALGGGSAAERQECHRHDRPSSDHWGSFDTLPPLLRHEFCAVHKAPFLVRASVCENERHVAGERGVSVVPLLERRFVPECSSGISRRQEDVETDVAYALCNVCSKMNK